uniref:Uncharacterized protein n=1 Tax=Arundo donax TaxID=35708 RepID=A0A0A8Y3E7_ARUDO
MQSNALLACSSRIYLIPTGFTYVSASLDRLNHRGKSNGAPPMVC